MESGALNDVPDDVAILFVHMINPWGCAWDRRKMRTTLIFFAILSTAIRPRHLTRIMMRSMPF